MKLHVLTADGIWVTFPDIMDARSHDSGVLWVTKADQNTHQFSPTGWREAWVDTEEES